MDNKKFMLPKKNVWLILAGFVIVVIGFVLMTGSKTQTEFNPDIYSFRRIVVAPIVCLVGFVFVIVAILYKGKTTEE
ncbi:MAG: DUF3098 domain-containing protein [Paludibacteraceae bacterium]